MSNFIYNDNFNDEDDKELINFNFNENNSKGGVSVKAVAIICTICIVFSAFFGMLGAFMFIKSSGSSSSMLGNVEVNIKQSTSTQPPLQLSNDAANAVASVVANVQDTVVVITTPSGEGSGVIVGSFKSSSESGYYIITNAHVIDGAYTRTQSAIKVTHASGTQYAKVLCSNSASDIAILKINETKELKCATFASDSYSLTVGEDVFAIGNSLGKFEGTVTKGNVSYDEMRNVEIDGNVMSLIQLDISVYPGNSGGGLFNLRGELVGIVNAKIVDGEVGRIGFAIPHTEVLKIYMNCIKLGGN